MSEDQGKKRLPDAVLFCCNFNQVRSPMAEALLKRFGGLSIFVDSCGLRRANIDADEDDMEVDPLVAEVMSEIGIDLTRHRCKIFDDLEDDSFDLVVSLTPEAHHRAVELARGRAAEIERDAVLAADSLLADLRETADALERRWATMPTEAWAGTGNSVAGAVVLADLPFRRWRETELHHTDLGLGHTPEQWPALYVRLELVRMERQWAARRPMGLTLLPPEALAAPPAQRLAWLVGRVLRHLPEASRLRLHLYCWLIFYSCYFVL
eukprot:gene25638-46720_t